MSLYSSGRTTGIIVDSGYDVTHIVTVVEGDKSDAVSIECAGNQITGYLQKLLRDKGYAVDMDTVNDIKHKMCVIDEDCDAVSKQPSDDECQFVKYQQYFTPPKQKERAVIMDNVFGGMISSLIGGYLPHSMKEDFTFDTLFESGEILEYKMPDENILFLKSERSKAAEILFHPEICGIESKGIHKLVHKSIMEGDVGLRKDMYANVLLAGGSTLFPGFQKRCRKELRGLASNIYSEVVTVMAPPERKHSSWIGGSIISSLSTFEEMWIK